MYIQILKVSILNLKSEKLVSKYAILVFKSATSNYESIIFLFLKLQNQNMEVLILILKNVNFK